MQYGVAYYPEHKTEEELRHDLKLIKESGINTVRMGEFAWCRMEPREGVYDFDWLEDVVNELGEAGISSILCTPTACPPSWMIQKHPDILYVDNRGEKRPFGGRRFYCYNNPAYREYSAKIAEEMGKRFGKNPYVSGFQIDNEPAQEASGRCCCPTCAGLFRSYLKKKYKTIEEYSRRSGTIFWGQDYGDFEEINPPVNTIEPSAISRVPAYFENPTLRLEFERFSSDAQIEYQNIQADILHKYTKAPVTTNGTGLATNSIDYYKSTKNLDVYAFDYYPGLRDRTVDSFPYAFARGIKDGKPFWVLEFMSGGGHKFGGNGRVQPNPGALKQAVVHSFAHGADMMLHFQFRTFPFGAEQLNYAIVDMDGVPRRRYYEMKETAALLKKLAPYGQAAFSNRAAVLVDYDTHWALRIKPVNDPAFKYLDYAGKLYQFLENAGYNADVRGFDADLSGYRLVILPTAFVLTRAMQEKLRAFVKNGGVLLATFLTSVKNEDNVGYTDTLPAGLTDVFGVTVEEVEPVFAGDNPTPVRLKTSAGNLETIDSLWCDLLKGEAEAIGEYTGDYKKGQTIVSRRAYGEGQAYYLGTNLEPEAMTCLLGDLAREAGLEKNPVIWREKVETVHRKLNGEDYYFVSKFRGRDRAVGLPRSSKDLLTGEMFERETPIERAGFRLLTAAV